MSNLAIWDALGKTDPNHTKRFKRAGGFEGTAVKPIWTHRRLTEQFGPCGVGWGFDKPEFQTIPIGEEMLVYCTVSAWHGNRDNVLFGVGGDKVAFKNKYGLQTDDEAFKKAFTDAIGNAFKHIGCGADVHMGQFDDSKYVEAAKREFSEPANDPKSQWTYTGPHKTKTAFEAAVKQVVHELNGCGDIDMLEAYLTTDDAKATIAQCQKDRPDWFNGWEGQPDRFTPLGDLIANRRQELALADGVPAFIEEQAELVGAG